MGWLVVPEVSEGTYTLLPTGSFSIPDTLSGVVVIEVEASDDRGIYSVLAVDVRVNRCPL